MYDVYGIQGRFTHSWRLFSDKVSDELTDYFYRTVRFEFGNDGALVKKATYGSAFPYFLRHVDVEFRSVDLKPEIEKLAALDALLLLSKQFRIRIIVEPDCESQKEGEYRDPDSRMTLFKTILGLLFSLLVRPREDCYNFEVCLNHRSTRAIEVLRMHLAGSLYLTFSSLPSERFH